MTVFVRPLLRLEQICTLNTCPGALRGCWGASLGAGHQPHPPAQEPRVLGLQQPEHPGRGLGLGGRVGPWRVGSGLFPGVCNGWVCN